MRNPRSNTLRNYLEDRGNLKLHKERKKKVRKKENHDKEAQYEIESKRLVR